MRKNILFSLPMESLEPVLIGITLALAMFLCFYAAFKNKLKALKHECLIHRGFLENLDLSFYLWDGTRRLEQFSLKSPNSGLYSFDKFAEQFVENAELKKNLAIAKSQALKFDLQISARNKQSYFHCHGGSILDKKHNIIGVVIFIMDSSIEINKREELQNKLKQAESKNNLMLAITEASPWCIWSRDHNLAMTFLNSKAEKIDIPHHEKLMAKKALATQKSQNDRIHFIINNQRKPFLVTENPYGKHIIGFAQNIEKLTLLEHKNNNFTKDRNALMQHLPTAITIYSPNHELIFFNPAFQKIFGFQKSWLETKPLYKEVIEQINQRLIVINHSISLNNILTPQTYIVSLTDRNNIHVNIIPCRNGDTIITYWRIYSKQKLADLHTASANLAFAVFNIDGHIELWDDKYLQMFNLDHQFIVTSPHIEGITLRARDEIITEHWHELQKQILLLVTAPDQGKPIRIKTKRHKRVVCTSRMLSNAKVILTYAQSWE